MLAGARRGLRVVARRRRPTAAAARFLSSETPETPAAVETPETPAVAPLVSSRHGYQETRPGGTSKFARHRIIAQQRDRLESMEAAADASGLRWRLATTLVVERTQQLMRVSAARARVNIYVRGCLENMFSSFQHTRANYEDNGLCVCITTTGRTSSLGRTPCGDCKRTSRSTRASSTPSR